MQRAQNRIIRTIFGDSDDSVYFSNRLLKVNETYEYFCLIEFFKDIILRSSVHFSSRLESIQGGNIHNTRFQIEVNSVVPHFNSARSQNSFIFKSVSLWNSLNVDIKRCNDLLNFKNKLYNFLLTRYSPN